MRTFIIRARKGTTRVDQLKSAIGGRDHFEVVAHSVINAFFVANDFRQDVEVYIVLDSAADFPRTLRLAGGEGISIAGFHEVAVLELVEYALTASKGLQKNATMDLAPGLQISGFGFERLISNLLEKTRTLYLLSPKGEDIRTAAVTLAIDPVFILSDHLAMPKNSVKGLQRQGVRMISLGKKMLFAAQCVVIIHHELDRAGI